MTDSSTNLSRRSFIRLAAAIALVGVPALLASCGGAAAPSSPASAPASGPAPAPSAAASAEPALSLPASAAAAVGSAAASGAYNPTPLSPPVNIKIGGSLLVGEAGVFAAMDKGYFKQEGIEAEYVQAGSTADMLAQVVTNGLQFASVGQDPSLFNVASRDVPVKIIGYNSIISNHDTAAGFVVRKDLIDSGRYKEATDFKGFTVAIPGNTGSQGDVFLEKFAAQGGWTLRDVKETSIVFPQMVTALGNKAVDAGFSVQPFVSIMENQNIAKMVATAGELFPGLPADVFVVSPTFANEQPDATVRVLAAFIRGQRDYWHAFVKKDVPPDEMYRIIANHTPFKNPSQIAPSTTSNVDPNGEMDPTNIQYEADAFLRYGTLKQKIEASTVIDQELANRAVARIGRINEPRGF